MKEKLNKKQFEKHFNPENWRCSFCKRKPDLNNVDGDWRWVGDRWEHLHSYPVGYYTADFIPKKLSIYCWDIVNPEGEFYSTIGNTREKVITDFLSTFMFKYSWKHFYKQGYRCKKVVISEYDWKYDKNHKDKIGD